MIITMADSTFSFCCTSNKKKRNRSRRKTPNNNPNPNPSVVGETLALKHCSIPSSTMDLLRKETLYSEARVLSLGPTFMSIYIPNLAIQRRIYYDKVEDLTVDWLHTTSTLLLDRSMHERSDRKIRSGRFRPLGDIAVLVSPTITDHDSKYTKSSDHKPYGLNGSKLEPLFFPLTLQLSSTVTVALHAVGRDIVARLYVSSYFH